MSSIALDFPRRALRGFMHRIEVPRDIAEVTDTDADNECDPLEAGIAHKEAAAIWDAVEGLYRTGYYPTILFCLRRQGKVVQTLKVLRPKSPESNRGVELWMAPEFDWIPVRLRFVDTNDEVWDSVLAHLPGAEPPAAPIQQPEVKP